MQITIEEVTFIYNKNTDHRKVALKDINLRVSKGELIGVIGHIGSGKSTFLQLLNGLIVPTSGLVTVCGLNTNLKKHLKSIREKVGLIFQFPESQLFGTTVFDDISFGLKNQGIKDLANINSLVRESMQLTGLDFAQFKNKNPFQLSVGEQRRVALAGVLVRQPEILVLDEPLAGLDPVGRYEMIRLLKKLNQQGITIIIVSHDMDAIYDLVNRLLIFNQGQIIFAGNPIVGFNNEALVKEAKLQLPFLLELSAQLKQRGVDTPFFKTVEEGVRVIINLFGGIRND